MTLSADEVNFLIRRYLQESGFHHTAFMFNSESLLDQTGLSNIDIPPQSLITILKKGMLYMQLEKAINEQSMNSDSPENIINNIMENVKGYDSSTQNNKPSQRGRPSSNSEHNNNENNDSRNVVKPPDVTIINPENIISLRGHTSSVFCESWSSDGKYLATGSGDATVIIWEIKDSKYLSHKVLDHATKQERDGMDVAAVAWNKAGTLLASCCYDGTSRLWTNKGELKFLLQKHTGSVFTVQFSPNDEIMLTGAADGKVIAWDVNAGNEIQVFANHTKSVNDVDWLDNKTFASASGDGKICICTIGQQKPKFTLTGHEKDINKIAWDPSKKILASCSDDKTIKIFRPYDRVAPATLEGHQGHIYIIKWMPGNQKILASGAFDKTVRVWDVQNLSCLYTITNHTSNIFAMSFSLNGEYFVSGDSDGNLFIWRTSDGAMIASFKASGGIFEIEWNPNGQNIAAVLADATVALIPTNLIPVLNCEQKKCN